jgi:low temperature requirement protein LtrA
VVLLGIVLSAAGLHHALVHPTERLTWAHAAQLCVGVGLYWLGLGLFRLALGLPGAIPRALGGLALGGVTVVAATASGLLALLCLLLGSSALVLSERRGGRQGGVPGGGWQA